MPAPTNQLKAALKRDEMQIGLWMGLRDRTVAEIAANAGFDCIVIDGEHGPYDIGAIEAQLQAISGRGAAAVVRVPAGEAWMLKQVLDLGAQSIVVPMVETAEEAERLVRATRYPPHGIRGLAAAVVRASGHNAEPDYAANANDEICLIVQAESRAAHRNIDAIAKVEGVDCVFIGPADLSIDMGHGGAMAPEVIEAIDDMTARIRKAGKAVGILAFDPDHMVHFAANGARFIAVGSDVFGLSAWMRHVAVEAQKSLKG